MTATSSEFYENTMDPRLNTDTISAGRQPLSIVIPVYRSEGMLERLVAEIEAAVGARGYRSFELIFVNDGSPDASWSSIVNLADRFAFVHGICLMRNFGQHNAIMAGLRASCGEVVVLMDDDLQHSPTDIARLVDALAAGADVCYTHYVNRRHSQWKRLGSWFNNLIATWLLKKPYRVYLSSFKALRRCVVDEIVKYDGPFAYLDGLILDVTRSIVSVDIEHQERLEGKGNYSFRRSIGLWLSMATSFSVQPLRLASVIGFVLSGVALALAAAAIIEKLLHPATPPGWASIVAAVLFVGGAQLVCLGLLGEYLGRAYLKLNRKPQYAIRSTTPAVETSSRARPN
jgi:polyisoprenyl-phosphate glycosyltransferase